jgi:hypothetical protein
VLALLAAATGAALAVLVVSGSASAAAPKNDDFSSARTLGSARSGTVTGTTAGASVETSEPTFRGQRDTVWYLYESGYSGQLAFDVSMSGPEVPSQADDPWDSTVVGEIFSGDKLNRLALIGRMGHVAQRSHFTDFSHGDGAVIDVVRGTAYYVRISSVDNLRVARKIVLRWGPPAGNDSFAQPAALSSVAGTISGSTFGATVESREPVTAFGRDATVWYSWSAPRTGSVVFTPSGGLKAPVVEAYRAGSDLSGLELVSRSSWTPRVVPRDGALRPSSFQMPLVLWAEEGEKYLIRVVATDPPGPFTVEWGYRASPNDGITANFPILPGRLVTSNVGATSDRDGLDQVHQSVKVGSSIWFGFYWGRQSSSRRVRVFVDTSGSAIDTVVGVYRFRDGRPLRVTSNDDSDSRGASRVTFRLVESEMFWIVVGGKSGAQGKIVLTMSHRVEVAPPPNDDWPGAQALLPVNGGKVGGTLLGAARAQSDPRTTVTGAPTVWYAWIAPSDGFLQLGGHSLCSPAATFSSCPPLDIRLFTGSSPFRLTRVTASEGQLPQVQRGVRYAVLVAPLRGSELHDFEVTWKLIR